MQILLYLIIGMTIGALSGALGIGGGVLLVPALIWFCGFKMERATGTSLAILIPPIGLPAALQAYRADRVDIAAACWIAAAFAVGAFASQAVFDYLPTLLLRLLLGMVMVYVGVRFMLASDSEAANAAAGLAAAAFAWVGFIVFRSVGRRYLPPPALGDEIRRMQREGRGDPDYHI